MTVTAIINLLHKSVANKTYDYIPTKKNLYSKRKYGITILELEAFLQSINENDLISGPELDRDCPGEEVFIFKKKFNKTIIFYIKIKKDSTVNYERIKILSCHVAEY